MNEFIVVFNFETDHTECKTIEITTISDDDDDDNDDNNVRRNSAASIILFIEILF